MPADKLSHLACVESVPCFVCAVQFVKVLIRGGMRGRERENVSERKREKEKESKRARENVSGHPTLLPDECSAHARLRVVPRRLLVCAGPINISDAPSDAYGFVGRAP